jgi:hypothetical protein
LRVRVSNQDAARIGVADQERLANTDGREIAQSIEEQKHAQVEWARAKEMVRTVEMERKQPHEPQLIRVFDAKAQWAAARLEWRRVEVECACRHELAATARQELGKAEAASRNGADLDIDGFRGQFARLHQAWSQYRGKLAAAHAAADTQDRRLAEAKGQYAHDRLATAPSSTDVKPTSGEAPR